MLLHTLNLADMMPITSVWAGRRDNPSPLVSRNSPALLYAGTSGATPFRFNLHVSDLGHTLIVGPSGAGKSTALGLIAAQWFRYHVDLPVYRIRATDGEYELASGDEWRVSRAADVEQWFYDANAAKSPDLENGRQFRRVTRVAKKFARSRVSWKADIARGFTVTKLVEECYVSDAQREDVAFRETLNAIHGRLKENLGVGHPTTAGDLLATADEA